MSQATISHVTVARLQGNGTCAQVLQIIPRSMFELLDKIIAIQTAQLLQVPSKLDKEELKVYSQLELRSQVGVNMRMHT